MDGEPLRGLIPGVTREKARTPSEYDTSFVDSAQNTSCQRRRLSTTSQPDHDDSGIDQARGSTLSVTENDSQDPMAAAGFDRHSTLTAALVSTFYGTFFPSHPFLIPEKLYQQDPSLLPDHLVAIMCLLGSSTIPAPFVPQEVAESFQATAAQASSTRVPDDGFKVQSLMLCALSEYARNNRATAFSRLDLAVDLALRIGMNRRQSAMATDREPPPILDETWNRTWWELYSMACLFSATGSTGSWRRMSLAPVDRPLPGHCREYIECVPSQQHTPSELRFYRRRPPKRHCWSAFAFKIASIHLMGQVVERQSQTQVPSPPMAVQLLQELSLLVACMKFSGSDIMNCDGRIDEQLFSTSMILHLTRILLDWPEAGGALRKLTDMSNMTPDFTETTSRPGEDSIAAANAIINLIPLDLKLHRRTPCFGLALGMAAILYGVKYAQAGTATQSQNARSGLRLAISALRYLGEAHPLPLAIATGAEELAKRHTGVSRAIR